MVNTEKRGEEEQENTASESSKNGFFITEQNLKAIITDAVESAISNFMTYIKNEVQIQTKDAIQKLEGEIHELGVQGDLKDKALSDVSQK